MARAVYSTQLFSGIVVGPDTVTFDVPEGFIAVVRDVVISIAGGLDAAATFFMDVDGAFPLAFVTPAGWGGVQSWEGRMVSPGPSTIALSQGGSAEVTWNFVVSGYLLSA